MATDTNQPKDGPQNSPDGLGFKPKPRGVVRVNKKAVLAAGFFIVLMLLGIAYGVITRKPAAAIKSDNEEGTSTRLQPALQAGEQISRDIPDGNLPERKAKNDKEKLAGRTPGVLETPGNSRGPALSPATAPYLGDTPGAVTPVSSPDGVGQMAAAGGAVPNLTPVGQQGRGPNGSAVDPAIEKARRLREEREARLKQAMEAGTTTQGQGSGGNPFTGAPTNNTQQPSALQQLQALSGQQRPGTGAPGLGMALAGARPPGREEDDQNKQERKEAFLRDMEAVPDRNFVNSTRKAPLSRYEIKAGWVIPATMEHGINSDLPGKITARVTQNVYDTATGRSLMIPQGALLMGAYDSQVAYGQNGLLVVWRRIIFPDGSSLDLEGMGGVDESGYAGFRDQVNNHYGRLIGFGLMTSLFSAAFQISQDQKQSANGTPTASQTAGAAVAQQMSQLGIEIARRNLRIQPTIEIRPGYQFNVRVDKDLVFPRPYAYGNAQ